MERHHPSFEKHEMPAPSIHLQFFRHDEREPGPPDGTEGNNRIRLTAAARARVEQIGRGETTHPEMTLVYGSLRDRSVETAYHRLLGAAGVPAEDLSLEEMREMMDRKLKGPKKEIITEALNFMWEGSEEFREAARHRFDDTQDALVFLFEESDALVARVHDEQSGSYSRKAADIAELVKKYVKMLPIWQRIAMAHPEKYARFGHEIKRLLGSHGTVTECFLLKVIEVTQGREAARAWLKAFPNKNGFKLSEGYDVFIKPSSPKDDPEAEIVVRFGTQEWRMSEEQLDQIIQERSAV